LKRTGNSSVHVMEIDDGEGGLECLLLYGSASVSPGFPELSPAAGRA
jgi:hypothetical protein